MGLNPIGITIGNSINLLKLKEMEASQETKKCSKCGRVLPLSSFGKGPGKDGLRSFCKECMNKAAKQYREKRKIKNGVERNPYLAEFTPQDLISELRARGYEGQLTFTEVKVHKIQV